MEFDKYYLLIIFGVMCAINFETISNVYVILRVVHGLPFLCFQYRLDSIERTYKSYLALLITCEILDQEALSTHSLQPVAFK